MEHARATGWYWIAVGPHRMPEPARWSATNRRWITVGSEDYLGVAPRVLGSLDIPVSLLPTRPLGEVEADATDLGQPPFDTPPRVGMEFVCRKTNARYRLAEVDRTGDREDWFARVSFLEP